MSVLVCLGFSLVALRKESVDRNPGLAWKLTVYPMVALRKESVDRNCHAGDCTATQTASLSARRAWIEIALFARSVCVRPVALRKESVDRNEGVIATKEYSPWSLSARRAWIEIPFSIF